MASGFELVPLTSQKHDPAWKHCQMFKNGDRVQLKCLYCGKVFKGGGIHRIKEHLAGQKGNGATCLRVQPDVRLLMQESLNSVVGKKRKRSKISLDEIVDYNQSTSDMGAFTNPCGINTEVTSITVPETLEPISTFLMERGDETMSKMAVRKKKGRIPEASLSVTPCGGSHGTLGSSKRANSQVSMAIGRFFYDVGIPLDAAKSDYFQLMIDAIASQEEAVVAPTYHDLRNCILKNSLQEVRNKVDQCIGRWGKSGCSVLVDEWLSEKGKTFVNFLVYRPKEITFLRSVDISDILNSPDALSTLLKGVVEEVGTRNVLQVVTNTEERYVVASKRLSDDLPSVFWTPCASQCINLILEDFKRLDWISTIIEQAQYISRFIYNNSVVLNMMRRCTFGVDFLDTGASPLATDFATIKRMVQIKHNLQSMVTSGEWMDCPYSKSTEGFEMLGYISSQTFWSSCVMIVQLIDPLLRLLRLVSSEKRPAMGYVYAGIFRVKEAIKKQLIDQKEYLVYWNIIDQRWDQLRNHPLHVAGFYFNPKFYNPLTKDVCPNIPSPVFDCIEKLVPDPKIQDEIVKEIASYRSASGDFGREMAKRARNTLLPDEWWSTYGGGCPNLTRFAIHILSQTCSLVVPKPNFKTIQQMHETNNSLEHQRLSDLVYVHYNLLLGQSDRKNREQDPMDPIASENRGVVGDWLTVKEGCSEESGSSDWMTIDPPLGNTTVLGISSDDIEDLGSKFEDCEIFNIAKNEEAGGEDFAENVSVVE